MNYTVRQSTDTTEILLAGRLTFADHETFRSVLAEFRGPQGHTMVFDLSGLEFIDSSGLGMFIIARDTAQKRDLTFTIRGARDEVKRLITVARFHKMFDIAG